MNIFRNADWSAVLLCFLAAATFWFLDAMNDDYTADISYPVKIEYSAEKVIPVEKLTQKISFNASGKGWNLLRKTFWFSLKPIEISPSNLPRKKYMTSRELLPVVASQMRDLDVHYLTIDTLHLPFDQIFEKKIRLVADTSDIHLADGYKITSPVIINPSTITIKGPKKEVKKLPDSMHLNIPMSGISGKFEEDIRVDYLSTPMMKLNTNKVKVHFVSAPVEKEHKLLMVHKVNFPKNKYIHLSDRTVVLTYFIEEQNRNKVKYDDLKVEVDFKKIAKDSTIKPKLSVKPPYIVDFYFSPSVIKIKMHD
ncbi:MAG: hypothetical protein ACK40G_02275 [Cytophagaceae bacterium]